MTKLYANGSVRHDGERMQDGDLLEVDASKAQALLDSGAFRKSKRGADDSAPATDASAGVGTNASARTADPTEAQGGPAQGSLPDGTGPGGR